jgi:hypothetical protein
MLKKQDRGPASPTEHIASWEDNPEGPSSLSPLTPGLRIPIRTQGPLERVFHWAKKVEYYALFNIYYGFPWEF